MADKQAVGQTNDALVVSLTPDVMLVPLAPSTPTLLVNTFVAVPFTITGRFGDAKNPAQLVRFRGMPGVTSQSWLSMVTGDEAGTGGGVISGTVAGVAYPLDFSSTVRAGGGFVVRHNSTFAMNAAGVGSTGNTTGKVIHTSVGMFSFIDSSGKINGDTNPSLKAETQQEKDLWGHAGDLVLGFAGGAWDMAGGIWSLGTSGAEKGRFPFMPWTFALNGMDALGAAVQNPGAVIDAFLRPYQKAIDEGRPMDAVGRGIFDIGSLFFGLKGANKAARAAGVAAGDAAKAGRLAEVATAVKASELAKDVIAANARVMRGLTVDTKAAKEIINAAKRNKGPFVADLPGMPELLEVADNGVAIGHYRQANGSLVKEIMQEPRLYRDAGSCNNAATDYIKIHGKGKILGLKVPDRFHVWVETADGRIYDPTLADNLRQWGASQELVQRADKVYFSRAEHDAILVEFLTKDGVNIPR